jgi:phospholipase C
LESTSINLIFFCPYYLLNQYKKKGQENFATGNEDREVPLISELKTGWSSKENIFPQISHKDVETYCQMTMKK